MPAFFPPSFFSIQYQRWFFLSSISNGFWIIHNIFTEPENLLAQKVMPMIIRNKNAIDQMFVVKLVSGFICDVLIRAHWQKPSQLRYDISNVFFSRRFFLFSSCSDVADAFGLLHSIWFSFTFITWDAVGRRNSLMWQSHLREFDQN